MGTKWTTARPRAEARGLSVEMAAHLARDHARGYCDLWVAIPSTRASALAPRHRTVGGKKLFTQGKGGPQIFCRRLPA
jgi:hypothetical protein